MGKRLADRGHEVHVFTSKYHDTLADEEVVEDILVHRYPCSRHYLLPNGSRSVDGILKYSVETFRRLLGRDFDVCYSNQWPMVHSLLARWASSPLVQEWCEVCDRASMVTLFQHVLKLVPDGHVAVSDFTRRRLLSILRVDDSKIGTIPNGVDNSQFLGTHRHKSWGRIIYVGRLTPHKHVELLIDAFRRVKERAANAELHIVGAGPSLPALKERVQGINDCYFHGFLSESKKIDLLESSWIFVLPSEREGSSLVALEAMAAGLPLVTVNYPDNAVKELHPSSCLVAEPEKDVVASAIMQLLDNEDEWKTKSVNSIVYAKQNDWSSVARQMESYLRGVVHSAGG